VLDNKNNVSQQSDNELYSYVSLGHVKQKTQRFRILSSLNKIKQIKMSIPHYFHELKSIRGFAEAYRWLYFKFPYYFPLINFPPYVCVELTNKCNLSCKHCWREVMDRPEGFMDASLFKKIVREFGSNKHSVMKLLGLGEPTLHPRFREFLSELSSQEFKVFLYTNGVLFKIFDFDEILSWRLERIILSVDGTDSESYEHAKQGSRYAELKEYIEKFYTFRQASGRNKPFIEIRHVIMPEESEQDLKAFRVLWMKYADSVKFNVCEPADGLAEETDVSPPRCRSIVRERGILWDGHIPICGGLHRSAYSGNVNDSTITELWRHKQVELLRKSNRRREFDKVPECAKCLHCR